MELTLAQPEVLTAGGAKAARKLYIESYGCAMNFSDSEIVASVMADAGFQTVQEEEGADVIFLNTCAIRDNAESKIWTRLRELKSLKKRQPGMVVGVLGCMAERLKKKLLEQEQLVDLVAGPDAYRELPNLVGEVDDGNKAVNVLLSREETYAEINPVRLNTNGIQAFISIMRGCDNMCSFCVVPFTRGRERSRDPESIIAEAQALSKSGYKEVTLLGQNVDSYHWSSADGSETMNFAQLLENVALVNPNLRIRFSTSHPKDITDEVIYTIARHENICNYIHLPVQSGSSRILKLMNRTYDRDWYIERVTKIREVIPDCGISSDIITGFCSETDDEHRDTLRIMEWAQFEFCYMYQYSERPGTLAARKYEDDITEEVKNTRLKEIIALQNGISKARHKADEGKVFKVLVDGISKKSQDEFKGRNDQNNVVIFPKKPGVSLGDYVQVKVHSSTTTSLIGEIVD